MTFPTIISAPWEVYAGDTESVVYSFVDENGDPQDLSEYTNWACQWQRNANTTNSRMVFDLDLTKINEGEVRIDLTPKQTRDMGGPGEFDLSVTIDGDPRTLLRGRTAWMEDISR